MKLSRCGAFCILMGLLIMIILFCGIVGCAKSEQTPIGTSSPTVNKGAYNLNEMAQYVEGRLGTKGRLQISTETSFGYNSGVIFIIKDTASNDEYLLVYYGDGLAIARMQ